MSRYTNVVLTVIAVALIGLVVENAISSAHAAPAISRVAICEAENPDICVSVVQTVRETGTAVWRLGVQAP